MSPCPFLIRDKSQELWFIGGPILGFGDKLVWQSVGSVHVLASVRFRASDAEGIATAQQGLAFHVDFPRFKGRCIRLKVKRRSTLDENALHSVENWQKVLETCRYFLFLRAEAEFVELGLGPFE
ncbi:hypothetical protein PUV47_04545 [Pseudovibrio exalbescens]|uniref:hypothetical protein n=1 Tax=Pseudovibrio exalbescens TaxID=197461 RepID=UPI002365C4F3|nr:hypothetical protein [Pseudovibrio exalbescens]MDD7909175.1 hypothetical protein [Pseudovibrio exalbescens]